MELIDEMIDTLRIAKKQYSLGKPIMSDADFDSMEGSARSLDPNHEYFSEVGAEVSEVITTVTHERPMLSMEKLKVDENVEDWYKRSGIPMDSEIIIEPKVDGISGSIFYRDGKLVRGATRGNGKVGELISFIGKKNYPSVPTTIPEMGDVEVRGEFYIPVEFAKTEFKDKPLRNCCAGIIKSGENIEFTKFVAYNLFSDTYIMYEQDILRELRKLKFEIVNGVIVRSPKMIMQAVREYIETGRDMFQYETDGLVCIVNSVTLQGVINSKRVVRAWNFYNIAIKPPSKIATSKLRGYSLNVSKSGRVIPLVHFDKVIIANVEIDTATMNNYSFLKSFGPMFVGNTVYVKRANDVIPNLSGMDNDGDKSQPINTVIENCPDCGSKLEHVINPKSRVENLYCRNINCSGRMISIIYNWVERLDMKDVGFKFIEAAHNKGIIQSIEDLYSADLRSKMSVLDGFVEDGAKIAKIIKAIDKSRVNVRDIDIINAVGIPGIGMATLEKLNLTDIDTLERSVSNSPLAACIYIKDWLLVDGNLDMIKRIKKTLNSEGVAVVATNGPTVCITGTFDISRKEIESKLKSKGYRIVDSVSSNTEYLIVGEDAGSKVDKANKNGHTKIVSVSELI